MGEWLIWSFVATVCWGVAYTFLRPAGAVSPWVVQILYSGGSLLLNVVGLIIWSTFPGNGIRQIWTTLSIQHIYISGYIIFSSVAGFAYMLAAQQNPLLVPTITAITSAYPVVNTILLFLIYQDYLRVKLQFALPGIALVVTGCILLSLSSST